MKIWIDAMTGTWGECEDVYILTYPGLSAGIEEMSDNNRMAYALNHGVPLLPMVE